MAILSFWIPAAGMSLLVVGLVTLGLFRGARVRASETGTKREMRVYADQLKEIERDHARGLVSDDDAGRLRAETARRLLEADRTAVAATNESPGSMRMVALALVVLSPIGAVLFYLNFGAPNYRDMPLVMRFNEAAAMRVARPPQAQMEADWQADPNYAAPPDADPEFVQLMDRLRAAVATRPDDLTGLRLLAVNEGNLGNFQASAAAWTRVIEVQGDEAPLNDMVALAETMVQAAGGRISPEADAVLDQVLSSDPRNGPARYYKGLSLGQTGRPDLTFRIWRGLLSDSPPDAPWVPVIRSEIEGLADLAGVRFTLPPQETPALRGPSAEDVAAAADMTPQERQQLIGNMVEGLAARLANEGGSPEEWARLITALGTLGQNDRARAILGEARRVFASSSEAMAVIEPAAQSLGLAD